MGKSSGKLVTPFLKKVKGVYFLVIRDKVFAASSSERRKLRANLKVVFSRFFWF